MAGLVVYDSSDEDEDMQSTPVTKSPKADQGASIRADRTPETGVQAEPEITAHVPAPVPALASTLPDQTGIIGPLRPHEGSSDLGFPPLEEAPVEEAPAASLPPGSPYSANRALLRDLTLPTVPNMDIPPSPPGSPPPGTNKRFEQFLELKKKGVHFNSKIAQSTALKNPSLMDKLMRFVKVDQKDQYRTTLGADQWDPSAFPKSAYKEQLRQSQTEVAQAKARSKGGAVDFVAASGTSSQATTPSGGQVSTASTGKRKTRFET